jgi:hypothetical protein
MQVAQLVAPAAGNFSFLSLAPFLFGSLYDKQADVCVRVGQSDAQSLERRKIALSKDAF